MPARKMIPHICPICETVFNERLSKKRVYCSQKCYNQNRKKRSPKERFQKYIGKKEPNGCIIWQGGKDEDGYGTFDTRKAHRFSYEMYYGPIPKGMCVLHDCPGGDNPSCVNPKHLWLGTTKDNNADRKKKGHYNGEWNGNVKLTNQQVLEIRIKFKPRKVTWKMLGKEYGVSEFHIGEIISGKQWKHLLPQNVSR